MGSLQAAGGARREGHADQAKCPAPRAGDDRGRNPATGAAIGGSSAARRGPAPTGAARPTVAADLDTGAAAGSAELAAAAGSAEPEHAAN